MMRLENILARACVHGLLTTREAAVIQTAMQGAWDNGGYPNATPSGLFWDTFNDLMEGEDAD